MATRFWSSPVATWRLARFFVLALIAFIALDGFVGMWIAAVVAVVVAALSLIDEVFSRRTGTDRGGGAHRFEMARSPVASAVSGIMAR